MSLHFRGFDEKKMPGKVGAVTPRYRRPFLPSHIVMMPSPELWNCSFCTLTHPRVPRGQLLLAEPRFSLGLIILIVVSPPSVLVAGSLLTLAAVEATTSVFQGLIVSLIDSAVRNTSGAAG